MQARLSKLSPRCHFEAKRVTLNPENVASRLGAVHFPIESHLNVQKCSGSTWFTIRGCEAGPERARKGDYWGFLGGSLGAPGGRLGVLGFPCWPRELPRPRKDPPSPLKRPLRPLSRTPKTPQDSPKTPLKGILEGRPSPGLHEHLPENAREAPKAVPMYVQGRSVKTKTKISPVAR